MEYNRQEKTNNQENEMKDKKKLIKTALKKYTELKKQPEETLKKCSKIDLIILDKLQNSYNL